MSGPTWIPEEISAFLAWNNDASAALIAGRLGRSIPAVQGLRRKLKRLQELGAGKAEMPQLLLVNEAIVLRRSLREIRAQAAQPLVPVRHYLRRGRVTGRPHLVDDHARRPVEKPE